MKLTLVSVVAWAVLTGVLADPVAEGAVECGFANPPETPYYWEPSCEMGMVGCNADSKHLQCRFCGEGAYRDIACRPSLCTFPGLPPATPYFWDPACKVGKLGCLADGAHTECRWCGVGAYKEITCPGVSAMEAAVNQIPEKQAASPGPKAALVASGVKAEFEAEAAPTASEQCSFVNPPETPYYWEPSCEMGIVGCNADGKHVQCRFCGEGAYQDIACRPTLCTFPGLPPATPYFWDPTCEVGKLGCLADGAHTECRWCGVGSYKEITCPGLSALEAAVNQIPEKQAVSPGPKAALVASGVKVDVEAEAAPAESEQCGFVNPPETPYYWEPSCEMGIVGCNADGKHVQCRFCGEGAYKDIACRPTLCTFPGLPPATPYFWDPTCEVGKLGCLADGAHTECRWCGVGAYKDLACEGVPDLAVQSATLSAPASKVKAKAFLAPSAEVATVKAVVLASAEPEQCGFVNPPVTPYYWEPSCEMGVVGCNADGKHVQCRFCSEGAYKDIACRPSLCTFPGLPPTTPYFWDPTCEVGKLGCLADGVHTECRWCGAGTYKDIACLP